jgi:hypothetical protein
MYQAAQAVTPIYSLSEIEAMTPMEPQASAFVVTGTESAATSIAVSSQKSHVSGSTQMVSGSAHSNLSTGLSTITTGHNSHAASISASSTSSTSSGESAKVHPYLYNILAIYTITFTLFLIPIPAMSFVEFSIIFATAITGWTLLYLDVILRFVHDPRQSMKDAFKSFKHGLIIYGTERWYNLRAIRHFSKVNLTSHHQSRLGVAAPPGARADLTRRPTFRLDAWWKDDILSNLKKHNLRDYFNPADFTLEKYVGETPEVKDTELNTPNPVKRRSIRLHEEDIFSSDDELDTSPLNARLQSSANRHPMIYRRESTAPLAIAPAVKEEPRNISGTSKETCVDAGMSPREKVSGFISWDALKRDEGDNSASADAARALARIAERTNTDTSGSSWEKEAMGAAI